MASTQSTVLVPTIVYYDGWCNACIKAAAHFNKINNGRGLLECIDLRGDDPRIKLTGMEQSQLAASLHTRTPDGTMHAGPEAIRVAFDVLGRRHSAAWTGWPIIRPIVNVCYGIFARNRLRWFGNQHCKDGTCSIEHKDS